MIEPRRSHLEAGLGFHLVKCSTPHGWFWSYGTIKPLRPLGLVDPGFGQQRYQIPDNLAIGKVARFPLIPLEVPHP